MNNATKVGVYLAGLAVVFAAALGIGNAIGPIGPTAGTSQSPASTDNGHGGMDMDDDAGG